MVGFLGSSPVIVVYCVELCFEEHIVSCCSVFFRRGGMPARVSGPTTGTLQKNDSRIVAGKYGMKFDGSYRRSNSLEVHNSHHEMRIIIIVVVVYFL